MSQPAWQKLLQELKRRRVFRAATLYVVIFWPIIQIIDILSPAFNISDHTMRTALIYFVAGFPVVVILAWVYNLTPKGVVKNDFDDPESNERLIGNRLEVGLIVFLMATTVVLLSYQEHWFSTATSQENTLASSIEPDEINYDSIAVLPFVAFSEDKTDEFFADGLSEELLNVLAKIPTLSVAARTSSFAYKGMSKTVTQIGRDLGVDVILEGSVRRNDVNNAVRVTAQLIDVRTGTHLWSETYDRQFEDIFKIQDDITEAVVEKLKITLLGEQKEQLLSHDVGSPEALIAHSQGRTELAKRTASAIWLAKQYFDTAIEKDPNYATAYASLAETHILLAEYANEDLATQVDLAQAAVEKALSLDPNLGLAWAAQGLIYMTDHKTYDEARASLKKAIELNSSYAMAYMWYGSLQDNFDEATRLYRKAYQLNPKSPVAGFNLAANLVKLGRDIEAMDIFSAIMDVDPFYPSAYYLVGLINKNNGRIDQAIENFKKAYDLGDQAKSSLSIAQLYTDLGSMSEAKRWIALIPTNSDIYKRQVDWLEIIHYVIEENEVGVKQRLQRVTQLSPEPEVWQQMDAITGSYYLGNYSNAVQLFESVRYDSDNPEDLWRSEEWFMQLLYASYAYQRLEKRDESLELIEILKGIYQDSLDKGFRQTPDDWYTLALLDVIEGDQRMAFVLLQRAIDQGWVMPWRLDSEPILDSLREDKRFKDIRQSLMTRVSIIKEQLAYDVRVTQI